MNPTRMRFSALLLAAVCATAQAEDAASDAPSAQSLVTVKQSPNGGVTVRFDSMITTPDGKQVFGMTLIKDAPYSAQAIQESRQTLADGNQITERRDVTTYYRDSAGRLRQEIRDRDGELRSVVINDPVAGIGWTLVPDEHVAFKVAIYGRDPAAIERERAANTRAAAVAKKAADAHPATYGGRTIPVKPDDDMRIVVPADTKAYGPLIGSMLAQALGDAKWRAQAVTKDLGTRSFDGVKAVGRLRSYTIPAGKVGNRDAIVVSDETWVAPALQVTVYTKHSDPRSGEVEFRLENLKRDEPVATLFAVPAGYVVKAMPGQ